MDSLPSFHFFLLPNILKSRNTQNQTIQPLVSKNSTARLKQFNRTSQPTIKMCLPLKQIIDCIFRRCSKRGNNSQPMPSPEEFEKPEAVRILPSPTSTYSHYVDPDPDSLRSPNWVAIYPDGPFDPAVYHGYASLVGKGGNPYASSSAYTSSRASRKLPKPSCRRAQLPTWQ